jgi:hypothetical protein
MPRILIERELSGEGPLSHAPRKGRRSASVNIAESPLTWLHARGHLDNRQFAAGERLRADWERAQLSPNVTMSWNPVRVQGGDAGLNPTERQIAAKARFDGAAAAAGPALPTSSGGWFVPVRRYRMPNVRLPGRCAAASWC